ncbi:MAG: RNA polymerase sigma factor [Thermomicrobiales bacterium]
MCDEEREAIAALQRGDIGGLEALVRLHQLRAVRTSFAITGDRETAEDVVAEAFLTVYERISQFDSRRPFAPWFYRIVINGSLKAIRRTQRTLVHAGGIGVLDQWRDQLSGPEEASLTQEMREHLLEAVRALPPKQRAALILRYYLEMDDGEIGKTLGCPRGTVKWRLHAARQRLRQTLQTYYSGEGG